MSSDDRPIRSDQETRSGLGDHLARAVAPIAAGAPPLLGAPLHTSLLVGIVFVIGGARYLREWSDVLRHVRDTWRPPDPPDAPGEQRA